MSYRRGMKAKDSGRLLDFSRDIAALHVPENELETSVICHEAKVITPVIRIDGSS